MDKIIIDYLKEKGYVIDGDSRGIDIILNNNELLIKGSKLDLLELADYLVSVALSNNENDHLHLDELTIINKDSPISNLIIEKEKNNGVIKKRLTE